MNPSEDPTLEPEPTELGPTGELEPQPELAEAAAPPATPPGPLKTCCPDDSLPAQLLANTRRDRAAADANRAAHLARRAAKPSP